MKVDSSILTVCVIICSFTECFSQPCEDGQRCCSGKSNETNHDPKCDDDNDDTSDETPDITSQTGDDSNVFCGFYNPPVPDFSRPGQRISVTKCYEYIWEMNVRSERWRRNPQFCKPNIAWLVTQGMRAPSKVFPHMGAVGWISSDQFKQWKFMCGCTLISSKFVLTAAHCTVAQNDSSISDLIPKIVRFGVVDVSGHWDKSPEDHNIARIIVHPQYASPLKYFDIALFELDKMVSFRVDLQPSCLWTEDLDEVKNVTVTGWGVTSPGNLEGNPYLLYGILDVIDSEQCDSLLWPYRNRRWNGIRDHQFCAGKLEGGVDACQGDSGGPVQIRLPLPVKDLSNVGNMNYIVGVTSFGIKCGKKGLPGVYIKVSYFLDWIEKIVWG